LRTPNIKVIKAIFEKYGYEVVKIDRVSFAGLTKKNLPRGNWRVLTKQEIINLKHMVP
jgi:23S rRNA pseudouridine2605 synthase